MANKFKDLSNCNAGTEWIGDRDWKDTKELWKTIHRGDWMLVIFKRMNPDDLKELTLAKAHCANLVRHLMIDKRSLNAVDTAIAFGNGTATREELDEAAKQAGLANAAAASVSTESAHAADAAYYAASANSAPDAVVVSLGTKNFKKAADICRLYLPYEIWNHPQDAK